MDSRIRLLGALTACLTASAFGQNGTLDLSFQAEANDPVLAVVVQPDGKILVGGSFTAINGILCGHIARLNTNGTLDASFSAGSGVAGPVNASVTSIAVDNEGKVLIGGWFWQVDGQPRDCIARLNTNGALDVGFSCGTGAGASVRAVAVGHDNEVIIGGSFTSVCGSNRWHVARLLGDGRLDLGFDAGYVNGTVYSLTQQPDGTVFIGGDFHEINYTARSQIARLATNGTLDITFCPGSGARDGHTRCVVLLEGGKLLIGGNFSRFNGVPRNGVARLNSNGGLDEAFDPGLGVEMEPGSDVNCAAEQFDHKVVIAGAFSKVGGVSRSNIARLHLDGTPDETFSPGLDGPVSAVAMQPDGKLLLGGDFTSVNGVTRVRLARLNADVPSPAATLDVGMYAGVTISGEPGRTYRVEFTENLTNPVSWQTLEDIVVTNAPYFYVDKTAPLSARRFYRALALP